MDNGKSTAMNENPMFKNLVLAPTISGIEALKLLDGFSLMPGSPLIDRGMDLKTKFNIETGGQDFSGKTVPAGSAPDVGAFEMR